MNKLLILGAVGLAALFVAAGSFFTVHQTQQVLITQFGQPIRVIQQPGLNMKVPFIQSVIVFDRRLLDFEGAGEEVILGDQRRLIVDSFTRYRITDPLLFFQTVGATEAGIRGRLNSIVSSSLRRVLASEQLLSVLSADRSRIMGEIRRQVNEEALRFGHGAKRLLKEVRLWECSDVNWGMNPATMNLKGALAKLPQEPGPERRKALAEWLEECSCLFWIQRTLHN